jgi:adenylate kinase
MYFQIPIPFINANDLLKEVFKRRLQQFYDSTSPLLKYYSSPSALGSTKFVTLTGKTSDENWPELDSIISSEFRLKPRDAFRKPMQEANPLTHVDGPLYNLVLSSKL